MPAAAPSWPQSGTLLPSCCPHPAPAPSQWAWSPHSRAGLLGGDTGAGVTGTDVVQGVGDDVAEVASSSVDVAVVFSAVVCSIVVAAVARVVVAAGEDGVVTALVSPRMVSALRHVSWGHDVSIIIIIGTLHRPPGPGEDRTPPRRCPRTP